MAIRMRSNNDRNSFCCECGKERKKVLDMFDLNIGGEIFTICDLCNEELFRKTLRANCYTNGRVKSKEDIAVINQRARTPWGDIEQVKKSAGLTKGEAEEIKRKASFLGEEGDNE